MNFSDLKAAIPLRTFFKEYMGATEIIRDRYGLCPSCGQGSENSHKVSVGTHGWKCHKCDARGDLIEAAALFYGISKAQVIEKLGHGEIPQYEIRREVASSKPERSWESLYAVLDKLAGTREHNEAVSAYLLSRGISLKTQNKAIDSGLMRFLPSISPEENFRFLKDLCSLELLESAALLSGTKKFTACAYRPLVFFGKDFKAAEFRNIVAPTGNNPKVIRYGSKVPFYFEQSKERLLVCEGAIDLLSAIEMGGTSTMIGLPGAGNFEASWFEPWRDKEVFLCLDLDKTGQAKQQQIQELLLKMSYKVSIFQVQNGKDLNEHLMFEKKLTA